MRTYTKSLFISFAAAVCLLFVNQRYAQAGGSPRTFTVDENGNGTGSNSFGGTTFPIPFTLAPDPGPGGAPLALTYTGLDSVNITVGDVVLLEPGTGQPSD